MKWLTMHSDAKYTIYHIMDRVEVESYPKNPTAVVFEFIITNIWQMAIDDEFGALDTAMSSVCQTLGISQDRFRRNCCIFLIDYIQIHDLDFDWTFTEGKHIMKNLRDVPRLSAFELASVCYQLRPVFMDTRFYTLSASESDSLLAAAVIYVCGTKCNADDHELQTMLCQMKESLNIGTNDLNTKTCLIVAASYMTLYSKFDIYLNYCLDASTLSHFIPLMLLDPMNISIGQFRTVYNVFRLISKFIVNKHVRDTDKNTCWEMMNVLGVLDGNFINKIRSYGLNYESFWNS